MILQVTEQPRREVSIAVAVTMPCLDQHREEGAILTPTRLPDPPIRCGWSGVRRNGLPVLGEGGIVHADGVALDGSDGIQDVLYPHPPVPTRHERPPGGSAPGGRGGGPRAWRDQPDDPVARSGRAGDARTRRGRRASCGRTPPAGRDRWPRLPGHEPQSRRGGVRARQSAGGDRDVPPATAGCRGDSCRGFYPIFLRPSPTTHARAAPAARRISRGRLLLVFRDASLMDSLPRQRSNSVPKALPGVSRRGPRVIAPG